MSRRTDEEHRDSGTGLADLFMNCFLAILIVMFMFMLNQGVRAVASRIDHVLLERLMDSQQQTIEEAEDRVKEVTDEQKKTREKSKNEKLDLLDSINRAEADAQKGKDRERILEDQLADANTKSRAAKSLRIDISHDCTGSMSEKIDNTKSTTGSITRTLPNVLTEVEIGFIGYRNMKLAEIPIQSVKKVEEDGGVSIRRITSKVEKLTANGGMANTEQAIRASMLRMDAMSGSPRECLVVIGDVGTGEVSPGQPAVARRLVEDVKAWCERPGKNRRVLAIYTGAAGNEHEALFKGLGNVNAKSMFSTNDSLMFELIINAAFAPQEQNP